MPHPPLRPGGSRPAGRIPPPGPRSDPPPPRARREAVPGSRARCHGRAVRSGRTGTIRLSKPPKLAPILKSRSPSTIAATAFSERVRRSTPKRLDAPRKSRFQIAWPGSSGQRRMEHARDLGPARQPLGDPEGRGLVVPEPHGKGPESAERLVADVGRRAVPERRRAVANDPVQLLGPRRDRAQQEVRVAGDELGQRLDLDVDAVLEGPEVERRRPGVVQDHDGAARAGRGGDRRDVLDLERLRPRGLEVDDPRGRADEVGDARADPGIVEGDLDAVAREDLGCRTRGSARRRCPRSAGDRPAGGRRSAPASRPRARRRAGASARRRRAPPRPRRGRSWSACRGCRRRRLVYRRSRRPS